MASRKPPQQPPSEPPKEPPAQPEQQPEPPKDPKEIIQGYIRDAVGSELRTLIAAEVGPLRAQIQQLATQSNPETVANRAADIMTAQIQQERAAIMAAQAQQQPTNLPATHPQNVTYIGGQPQQQPPGEVVQGHGSGPMMEMALSTALKAFITNPGAYIRDIVTAVKTPSLTFDATAITLGQIEAIANARRDEFEFIAQKHLADPVWEEWPKMSARNYAAGYQAAIAGMHQTLKLRGGNAEEFPWPDRMPEPPADVVALPRRRPSSTPTPSLLSPPNGSTNGSGRSMSESTGSSGNGDSSSSTSPASQRPRAAGPIKLRAIGRGGGS